MIAAPAAYGVAVAAKRLSDIDLGLARLLDASEVARGQALRSPRQRDRFVAGRIALRLYIAELTGDSPESLIADYACPSCRNKNGQGHGIPAYRQPSRIAPLHVSLSRSGDWCLLAAALEDGTEGIGVDLETQTSAGFHGFPNVAMTKNERETLSKLRPSRQAAFQTRLWVRKEATLKALGTGLAVDPATIDVSGPAPKVLGRPPLAGQWHLTDLHPSTVGLPDNFIAATALRRSGPLSPTMTVKNL